MVNVRRRTVAKIARLRGAGRNFYFCGPRGVLYGALPMRLAPVRSWLPPSVMALGVIALYWPPTLAAGSTQLAMDFRNLHVHRLNFARDALFGAHPFLPAWYPRELTGTPFWSNIQNFPFLPTRLVLLAFDPLHPATFAVAAIMAGLLAALFTYLLGRRLGLGEVAAAAAGWTFPASCFFACRVTAGHLPLLEVFAALPLLLWAVECLAQEPAARRLAVLAGAAFVVMLGGHPQVPFYSLVVAGLYVPFRLGLRTGLWAWGSMGLGAAGASFVWIPMLRLIGRSTRVLPLAKPDNDVALPLNRLASLFWPWTDGASEPVASAIGVPETKILPQVFWDTTAYVGLLPWIAVTVLLVFAARRVLPSRLSRAQWYVLAMGGAALVLALPWSAELAAHLPGTFLRSSSRLLYVTELSLALGLGFALDQLARLPSRWAHQALPVLLALHAIDLGHQSRYFVMAVPQVQQRPEEVAGFVRQAGDWRVAIDHYLALPVNRSVDDVGFFDSIMLARPYRTIFDWAGLPADLNTQFFHGSDLPPHVLRGTSVRWVVTLDEKVRGLKLLGRRPFLVYEVDQPLPRASFFPRSRTRSMPAEALHATLRREGANALGWLLLPGEPSAPTETPGELGPVQYERRGPDEIVCRLDAPVDGHVVVVESFDEGWSAQVDGKPVALAPAMDAWLAVPVTAGHHELSLRYRTVGAPLGLAMSGAALLALGVLLWLFRASRRAPGRAVAA